MSPMHSSVPADDDVMSHIEAPVGTVSLLPPNGEGAIGKADEADCGRTTLRCSR